MKHPFRFWMTGSVAVVMTTASMGNRAIAHERHTFSQFSRFRVIETVERIEACAQKHGLSVFARLGQPVAAHGQPDDAMLIVFESASGGTPVVMASADAAPEVPLAVCVRSGPQGHTEVIFNGTDWDDLPDSVARDLTELPILVADALS